MEIIYFLGGILGATLLMVYDFLTEENRSGVERAIVTFLCILCSWLSVIVLDYLIYKNVIKKKN